MLIENGQSVRATIIYSKIHMQKQYSLSPGNAIKTIASTIS